MSEAKLKSSLQKFTQAITGLPDTVNEQRVDEYFVQCLQQADVIPENARMSVVIANLETAANDFTGIARVEKQAIEEHLKREAVYWKAVKVIRSFQQRLLIAPWVVLFATLYLQDFLEFRSKLTALTASGVSPALRIGIPALPPIAIVGILFCTYALSVVLTWLAPWIAYRTQKQVKAAWTAKELKSHFLSSRNLYIAAPSGLLLSVSFWLWIGYERILALTLEQSHAGYYLLWLLYFPVKIGLPVLVFRQVKLFRGTILKL